MNKIFIALLFLSMVGAGILFWLMKTLPGAPSQPEHSVGEVIAGEKGEKGETPGKNAEKSGDHADAKEGDESKKEDAAEEEGMPKKEDGKDAAVKIGAKNDKGTKLAVSSTPVRAQVFVDGDFKGQTPLEIELGQKAQAVKLTADGFDDYIRETPSLTDAGSVAKVSWKIQMRARKGALQESPQSHEESAVAKTQAPAAKQLVGKDDIVMAEKPHAKKKAEPAEESDEAKTVAKEMATEKETESTPEKPAEKTAQARTRPTPAAHPEAKPSQYVEAKPTQHAEAKPTQHAEAKPSHYAENKLPPKIVATDIAEDEMPPVAEKKARTESPVTAKTVPEKAPDPAESQPAPKEAAEPAAKGASGDLFLSGNSGPAFVQIKAIDAKDGAESISQSIGRYRNQLREKVRGCRVDLGAHGRWTRVLVGPFKNKSDAKQKLDRIRSESFNEAFITGAQECL